MLGRFFFQENENASGLVWSTNPATTLHLLTFSARTEDLPTRSRIALGFNGLTSRHKKLILIAEGDDMPSTGRSCARISDTQCSDCYHSPAEIFSPRSYDCFSRTSHQNVYLHTADNFWFLLSVRSRCVSWLERGAYTRRDGFFFPPAGSRVGDPLRGGVLDGVAA